MHTTMVPIQVKTLKIQAGVQVSRPEELRRHLQHWKRFGRLGNASKLPTMSKTIGYSYKNDNIITSNSYYALNEEEDEEEDVENVYDETANLFSNTKTGGSLSFMDVAGSCHSKIGSSSQQQYDTQYQNYKTPNIEYDTPHQDSYFRHEDGNNEEEDIEDDEDNEAKYRYNSYIDGDDEEDVGEVEHDHKKLFSSN
ncbi:hypothetical protein Tco_0718883 [Tanacetum coccineum]